ncbi:MAG: helix-turn-helix domain-containing protein [Woeseiaceae bacterium]
MGARIRQCRHARKRTQSDVAAAVGVSKAAISKWESDGSALSAVPALNLARFLRVNPYWLIFGQGKATDGLQHRDLSGIALEMAHRFDSLPKKTREAFTALVFALDADGIGPT